MPTRRHYAAAGVAAALAASVGAVAVTNGTASADSPVRDVIAVPSGNGAPNVPYVVVGDTVTGTPHQIDDLRTGHVQSAAIAPVTNVVAYAAQRVQNIDRPDGDTPRGIMLSNPDGSGHRWLVAPRSGIDVFDVSWNVVGTKLLWSQQRAGSRTSYLWTLDVTTRGAQPAVVDGSANIQEASFSRRTFHTIVGASPAGLVTLTDGARSRVGSVARAEWPRFTPHDAAVVYTERGVVKRIATTPGATPETIASDRSYRSGDISPDGSAVYATVRDEIPGFVYRIPLVPGSTGTPVLQRRPADSDADYDGRPSAARPDTLAPHPVTDVFVKPDGYLHWTLPRDIDFSHVEVRRYYTADAFPGPTEGALVYAGRRSTFTDTVERGRTILWGVFVVDGSGNVSQAAYARLDG